MATPPLPCLLRLAFLLLLFTTGACSAQPTQGDAPGNSRATTIFLVRHAEKAPGQSQDPPLSEAGQARSEALARMLVKSDVKGIYTSQFLRTRQTAEPLANRLGIEATAVPLSMKPNNPREISEESLQGLLNGIQQHAGEAVLIVGHSNSIPEVIRLLGGDIVPVIEESSFDDLFIVTLYSPGRAKVVHLNYGNAD